MIYAFIGVLVVLAFLMISGSCTTLLRRVLAESKGPPGLFQKPRQKLCTKFSFLGVLR